MKRVALVTLVSGLVLALALGISVLSATASTQSPTGAARAPQTIVQVLTADETADLVYMVEEEKLARDVYAKMYELWGLKTFANIANAELRHVEHVREVLKAHGVNDPTALTEPGEFADARLQKLYNTLVKKGSESPEAALAVGTAIEDVDIYDLESRKARTNNPDVVALYDNLTAGSESHMRAFAGQLRARGIEYKPEHISPERYSAIVAEDSGRGAGDACGRAREGRSDGQVHGARRGSGRGRGVCDNCSHAGN